MPPDPPSPVPIKQSAGLRPLHIVLFLLAAILIGRASITQNTSSMNLAVYESGTGAMPYQGRYLMVPVLRWAASSPFMIHASRLLLHSSRGPEDLTAQAVNVTCLVAMIFLAVSLRARFSPSTLFPWLAPALLLWITVCTYIVRQEQSIYYPYDFLSALLFTVGILGCVDRRPVLFVLAVLVGSYNRETVVFLLPIWLACNLVKTRWITTLSTTVLALLAWVAARAQIETWVHPVATGWIIPWRVNLSMLLPHHWPQLFSVGGFLPILIWLRRDLIEDRTLRRVWLGAVPLLLANLAAGWWTETRIFGEVNVLIAVTAALQFEQHLRRNPIPASAAA
jgi:NADH:ubiquinone oxidoreductase subunit K